MSDLPLSPFYLKKKKKKKGQPFLQDGKQHRRDISQLNTRYTATTSVERPSARRGWAHKTCRPWPIYSFANARTNTDKRAARLSTKQQNKARMQHPGTTYKPFHPLDVDKISTCSGLCCARAVTFPGPLAQHTDKMAAPRTKKFERSIARTADGRGSCGRHFQRNMSDFLTRKRYVAREVKNPAL